MATHPRGTITVEPITWRGSIWLKTEPSVTQPLAHAAHEQQPRARRSRQSVLVVDDERDIVKLLAALLEDEGYRVVSAFDGAQAWELANAQPPDLVISDVMMPRMNGFELVDRFRESGDALAGTPVILMSAATRDVPTVGVSFLPKPFDLDRMLSLVSTELAAD